MAQAARARGRGENETPTTNGRWRTGIRSGTGRNVRNVCDEQEYTQGQQGGA